MPFLLHRKAGLHWLVLLFIGSCLFGMLLPAQAQAATGVIADDAQVLNTSAVRQYTDPFSYNVDIFTTSIFQGSTADFDSSVQSLTSSNDNGTLGSSCDPTHEVGCELFRTETIPVYDGTTSSSQSILVRNSGDPDTSVEIGIDVPARHIAIYAGRSVTLPQDHYDNAIQAFANTMHQTHDNYTQAMIATLNALQRASDRFWNGVHAALPLIIPGVLIVGLIILSIVGRAKGWRSGSSSTYYHGGDWGGGFGGGGGSSGGGGGGGGASGNF